MAECLSCKEVARRAAAIPSFFGNTRVRRELLSGKPNRRKTYDENSYSYCGCLSAHRNDRAGADRPIIVVRKQWPERQRCAAANRNTVRAIPTEFYFRFGIRHAPE